VGKLGVSQLIYGLLRKDRRPSSFAYCPLYEIGGPTERLPWTDEDDRVKLKLFLPDQSVGVPLFMKL